MNRGSTTTQLPSLLHACEAGNVYSRDDPCVHPSPLKLESGVHPLMDIDLVILVLQPQLCENRAGKATSQAKLPKNW